MSNKYQIKTNRQQDCPPGQEPSPKRKRVECVPCKKVFKNDNALNDHLRDVHNGKRKFVCKICNKYFRQNIPLNNHVASKHPRIEDLGNNKVFRTKGPVNRPVLIPAGDQPYGYQVCGKGFATDKQLAQHVQSHIGGKPAAYTVSNADGSSISGNCELPVSNNLETHDSFVSGNHDKKSAKRLQLRVQQLVHSGRKRYHCKLCRHAFASRIQLQLHTKKRHAVQKPFVGLQRSMVKYWSKRYSYFSRYDEGIQLDEESWYSVTPEKLAEHHAERMACDVIIDAFCGAGGNTVQFAKTCKHVIAIDIDPVKIAMAKHNAGVYGVDRNIDFIVGDFLKLAPTLSADVVFLSPPWGGPSYKKKAVFDLETMLIPVSIHELMAVALKISPNVAAFLPKNSNTDVLSGETAGNRPCEIERNQALEHESPTAITAYFGDLANLPLEPDADLQTIG